MKITLSSTVLITDNFEKMRSFYQDIIHQKIEVDFGNCIGFKSGLSIWKLKEEYPIAQKLEKPFHALSNGFIIRDLALRKSRREHWYLLKSYVKFAYKQILKRYYFLKWNPMSQINNKLMK